VINISHPNFNHAITDIASSKEKSWQQVVFTEAVPQVGWLRLLVLNLRVCMAILPTLVVHILNGLFLENQPLRQQRQQVDLGTLLPM
jgi:hypothetical protein